MGLEPPTTASYMGRPTSKCESSNPVLGSISRCFWHQREPSVSLGTQPGQAGAPLTQWALLSSGVSAAWPQECPLSSKENRLAGRLTWAHWGQSSRILPPPRSPPSRGLQGPPLAHRQTKSWTSDPSQRPDPECGGGRQHTETHTMYTLTHAWTRVCTRPICALHTSLHVCMPSPFTHNGSTREPGGLGLLLGPPSCW